MPEFFKMTTIHYKMTEAFLVANAASAAPVYSLLEFQGTKIKSIPENIDVYLYGSIDGITGLMVFLMHEHLFILSGDRGLMGKYDFLKLIRSYRPKWIKGNPGAVHQVMHIAKPFSTIQDSNDIMIMMAQSLPGSEAPGFGEVCRLPEALDLKEAAALMQRIEKAFALHPSSINRLKQRIVQRVADGEQIFCDHGGELIAHGAIEYYTPESAMLGGIYVDPVMRGKGCGGYVTRALMKRVFDKNMTPILCVYTDNSEARGLYEALGFKTQAILLEIHLDYDRS
ncbi:GNAT family N-acetyltransferase [Acidaminobacter hydrogenoformans]|uniref:FR47-like protein n=1 Tax=Acidaminobacter hydrogenoformans DSM 2784 TaxID=1120920 RepID=A0A1G5S4I3_9FIRM|nr:GNAT family N-acetyltransferase [Acidaminobacter hydrogenoformans]SCZ81275.1 FR47-like protein [Acidaminobacter hydrogenoformans DSM 2784]